jgi:hypothetical protein
MGGFERESKNKRMDAPEERSIEKKSFLEAGVVAPKIMLPAGYEWGNDDQSEKASPPTEPLYWHKLNKGGLEEIMKTQRLKATEARISAGGAMAVRAHVGDFKTHRELNAHWWKSDSPDVHVEFTTEQKPSEHPAYATWHQPDGGFLPIKITGVFDSSGRRLRPTEK